jgi:two-component system sensor histidine kinase UhpB
MLDDALGDMAGRVAAFSKSRLAASRVSLGILMLLVFLMGAFFLFLEWRIRRESAEGEESRALARALISAQEAERIRVAQELHDAVAQDLAAAKLYCGLAAADAEGEGEGDARRAASLLDRSIGELRDICQGLRPAELDRLGISDACAQLCAETAAHAGLEVGFQSEGFEGLDLDAELEINIYRVLQEALTNVRRHAKARHVKVELVARTVSIRLRIEDDGVGPGASQPGLGRRGMEERARMLGGGLEVSPGPSGGTVVSAWFVRPGREQL